MASGLGAQHAAVGLRRDAAVGALLELRVKKSMPSGDRIALEVDVPAAQVGSVGGAAASPGRWRAGRHRRWCARRSSDWLSWVRPMVSGHSGWIKAGRSANRAATTYTDLRASVICSQGVYAWFATHARYTSCMSESESFPASPGAGDRARCWPEIRTSWSSPSISGERDAVGALHHHVTSSPRS
jgi:hypothetical protein